MSTPSTHVLREAAGRFRQFLREHDLRLTAERKELLRIALGMPAHFDADQMVAKVLRKRKRVSRATIYRTLALLEQCGLLRKSILGKDRAVYEPALGKEHHDHLVCTSCGRIQEFTSVELELHQQRKAEEFGFKVTEHVHEVFGICRDCQESESSVAERAG